MLFMNASLIFVLFMNAFLIFVFSPALLSPDIDAQQRMHGHGACHIRDGNRQDVTLDGDRQALWGREVLVGRGEHGRGNRTGKNTVNFASDQRRL